jgi:hypothetical protein
MLGELENIFMEINELEGDVKIREGYQDIYTSVNEKYFYFL